MTTLYRGISFQTDSGCYYTESRAIAATYAGWRHGSDCERVVCVEINPTHVFDANSTEGLKVAQFIAATQGWDPDDVEHFADHYDNKPHSFFIGLVKACWRTAFFAGNECTNEQAEECVKATLKAHGFDAIKQVEKGGAKYPDGTLQLANKKAMAWILL